MLSFFDKGRRKKALAMAVAAFTVMALAGCGKQQQAPQATLVKTMEVIKRDTPIVYDYTGFVQAQKEVNLMAQVSGQITGKYFLGGEKITAGQTLFTIDQRTYQAKVLNAQAGLASAQATLIRTSRDLERYEQNAVSKQELDNRVAEAEQAQATVDAQQALLENANIDLGETNVVAPFDGRIDTNDLSIGNYVTAGQTILATISNTDPVFVEFSMAENEYLKLLSSHNDNGGAPLENLTIVLSDGTTYGEKGRVDQVNRSITQGTGTLTLKAEFPNPAKILLPGMFAHLQANSGTVKDAKLIPQRAVTELMYKKFVYVLGDDNKVSMREVTLGPRIGRLWLVGSGLEGNETVVVEGINKIKQGSEVKPEPMTEAELDTALPTNDSKSN
ncbi:MAG: efflux RND transporter periplasmic adaptor subunit [Acidaminococcaceae bacterium]|nr:efflux RND transporter periplasmic adaptor subunit [Acidaminococcaceae bacterium]